VLLHSLSALRKFSLLAPALGHNNSTLPQPVNSKVHSEPLPTGDPLGVCELMLGYRRLADLTADSMVQCLVVPAHTFLNLVRTVPGVYTRAWQATAAQLAAQHHHILGRHDQLASLNWFFRWVGPAVGWDTAWDRDRQAVQTGVGSLRATVVYDCTTWYVAIVCC
jgi:hypothetical protein